MSITFEVSQVAPNRKPLPRVTLVDEFAARGVAHLEACGGNLDALVGYPRDPSALWQTPPLHGLVSALQHAFDQHYPLVLSPDDIWLCIAQGFALHVNANAEALRGRFVRHDGRSSLTVRRDNFVKGAADNPWPEVFSAFSGQIADHIGKKRDLIVADFSTTGVIERAASEIVLMDAMQSYFQYTFITACGIPRITLLGTVSDWQNILVRARNLAEFGLEEWVAALEPVIVEFIAAAEGRANREFWQSMYKLNDESGGPYVTGWCNALFPYLPERGGKLARNRWAYEWQDGVNRIFGGGPKPAHFPSGLARAPLQWEYHDTRYAMEFVGGFAGLAQHEDLSVQPVIGWAVGAVTN